MMDSISLRSTHHGSILLEIIIGIAISSLIGVALMNTFFQSNTMVQVLDDIFTRDRRTSIMNHIVERDISGIFIPEYVPVKEKKATSKPTPPGQQPQKKEPEPARTLEKVFYAVHGGDGNLKTLSFITTSVLGAYGVAKPRIARVVYRVDEIKGEKDAKKTAYKLTRQESDNLDFDAFKPDAAKPIRAFEIVDNVKNITCEYGVLTKKDKKTELKLSKEWLSDEKGKSKDKKQEEKPKFPDIMILHVALWDAKKQRDFTTDIMVPILSDHALTATAQGPGPNKEEKDKKDTDDKTKKDMATKAAGQQMMGGLPGRGTAAAPGPGMVSPPGAPGVPAGLPGGMLMDIPTQPAGGV